MLNEVEFRKRFGEKLKILRKQRGITQGELAEKLNYSDKAVSKWERGESVPDSYTLYIIAEHFGVTVNDLISDSYDIVAGEMPFDSSLQMKKSVKIFVPFITALGMLFICSVAFFVMKTVPAWADYAHLSFILGLPFISLVMTILSAIWWNAAGICSCVSALIWTTGIALYTAISAESMKYLFICCLILQTVCVMVYLFTHFGTKKEKKSEEKKENT